jgi:predicted metalloprotease with PDZ domain
MRKNIFALFILLVLSGFSTVNAMNIQYSLKMPKPQNHYFEVEMLIEDYKEATLEVKMPVWAPGSYLVREFAKNVNLVKAFDEKGNVLAVQKTNKNTWKIQKGNAKSVKVKYEVYSFELSVRTSFLDLTHGYVSGTGVFMYVENHQENKGQLVVYPYAGFKKISTALPKAKEGMASDGAETFEFANYDQLVDCPIEIGNHIEFSFQSAGVNHRVAMYGDGNFDVEQLKKDMAKITATATQVIGENPNKEYLFIVHNVVDGQGGLEHINSTTLSVNRWTYQGGEYIGFLSLVAHEYFHLWNVKRIRPVELGPFNYDEENYTSLLWVMEGFTSYYDELLLLRAGYYNQEQYIQKVLSGLNYVEGSEGSRVQPVAHASFDAWIKSYRPNENSSNTTMTYYSRGGLLAAVLDAKIVTKFNGKKSLDDFMQKLYQDFYKDNLYYVNLKFIYVNRENEIDKIKQESFLMSRPNYISREEIIQILKESSIDNDKRYSLLSILKYNITLDADEIKNFLLLENEERNYLNIIKNIDAISFDKTIGMFQDINDLILVFYEKSNELKKIDPNNVTKKIYFRSNTNKKTIKKQYKD